MPYVDRTVFTTNDQSSGEVADPNKLEANDSHLADVLDANYKELLDYSNGNNISQLGIVNVKDYGAKGDGSSDDYNKINDIFIDYPNGVVIYFPEGTYLVSQSLNLPNNTKISGQSKEKTIIKATGAINTIKPTDYCTVENVTTQGEGKTGSEITGILIDNAKYCHIENVESKENGFHGIALTNGSNNNILKNIYVHDNEHRGLLIDPNAYENQVYGLKANNNTRADILIGHGSHGNVIKGAHLSNTGNASIWIHSDAYKNQVSDFTINNPGSTSPGVLLSAHSRENLITDFIVIGNQRGVVLKGDTIGDASYSEGDTKYNVISNFNLFGDGATGSYGIGFDQGSAYVPRNNVISDGQVVNFEYGIRDVVGVADTNTFDNITPVSISNQIFSMGTDYGNSVVHNIKGYTPFGSLALESAHPNFPASGVNVTNPFPFSVTVYIENMPSDGNVQIDNTQVTPSGVAPNGGNGAHFLGVGQQIKPIYTSGTPSWRWFGI